MPISPGERRSIPQPVRFGKPSPFLNGLRCIKCAKVWPLDDHLSGCPACAQAGTPASVAPSFFHLPSLCTPQDIPFWMAYPGASELGEGNTPLIDLPRLATQNDLERLMVKNEAANPSGSHKDRMSAALVRRALDIGPRKVALASSGNAGASLAAYCASAGIECVVVTTQGMAPGWRRSIELSGAELIVVGDPVSRWELIAERVRSGEWYPATNFTTPAVGSNPFAVDGLRAMAFELYLTLGSDQPTDIVVPVSRADLLWGITKGYADLVSAGLLKVMPRIHAAEPFPRISRALAGENWAGRFEGQSPFRSLGGDSVTYQAIAALQQSRGLVVSPDTDETITAQVDLGRQGLFVETSSAIVLSGLQTLRRQSDIARGASVLLVATSHGYKEVDSRLGNRSMGVAETLQKLRFDCSDGSLQ
ncbi:pyridoxal-phosphate dependent enzyme [Neorhizobium sp. BT27B]|uniref:threonine synthase n=1 Tax=Neorhizobium sp. BT27B TaxID=3142625 RepID=UPI003D2E21F1